MLQNRRRQNILHDHRFDLAERLGLYLADPAFRISTHQIDRAELACGRQTKQLFEWHHVAGKMLKHQFHARSIWSLLSVNRKLNRLNYVALNILRELIVSTLNSHGAHGQRHIRRKTFEKSCEKISLFHRHPG